MTDDRSDVQQDVRPDVRAEPLLKLLDTWIPPSHRAERSLVGMIELLTLASDAFERDGDRHHLTASAIVRSERGILLHRHKLAGIWMQPGGHIDPGEMPDEAAIREVFEETGIRARHVDAGPLLLTVDVHLTVNHHVHYDLAYLLEADGVDPMPPEGESPDVGWFVFAEAMAMTDRTCRELIARVADAPP